MTNEGAWICRACWKTNRPSDHRCYRCHTPRTADDLPIEGQRAGDRAPSTSAGVGGVLGILVALPAIVFSWFWRLCLLAGVFFLGITVLVALEPRAPPLAWLVSAGFAGGMFLLAFAMRWASRAMRHRNPWAFVIALAFSVGIGGFSLFALSTFPPGTGNPDPMRYATIGVFGFTAIMAVVGLLLSLAPDDGA